MIQKVELSLQEWYEKMEASPGLYDGLREIGEDGSIGPQERLQEMFLKRLNGFSIGIAVTPTEEFGDVMIDGGAFSLDFDITRLRAEGMTSVLPFSSDKGVKGNVRLDWQSSLLTFVPEFGEPSVYAINEYLQTVTLYGVGHRLEMQFLCVISPLMDEDAGERGFLSNLSSNKFHVEGLIFANRDKLGKDGYFNPQANVTFKDIAEITGVPASTLSNIRNGKKSLDNLTWKTLSVLSFYAQIRMLDAHIIDMMRRQLTGDVPSLRTDTPEGATESNDDWIATHGQDFEIRCVVVSLRDGSSYKLEGNGHKLTEQLYEVVMASYEDDRAAMDLKFAVDDSGEKLHRVMVPKVDVSRIHMDRYKPYADAPDSKTRGGVQDV